LSVSLAEEDPDMYDYWSLSSDTFSSGIFASGYFTAPGQWAAILSYGTIRGIASCNDTVPSGYVSIMSAEAALEEQFYNGSLSEEEAMSQYQALEESLFEYMGSCDVVRPSNTFSSSSSGRYCWCKITDYTPTGGNQYTFQSSSWVFIYDMFTESGCAEGCASYCLSPMYTGQWGHMLGTVGN